MNITTDNQTPFGAAFMVAGTELAGADGFVTTASINPVGTHLSDGHHPSEDEETSEDV